MPVQLLPTVEGAMRSSMRHPAKRSAKGVEGISSTLRARLENWGGVMRVAPRVEKSQTYLVCSRLARQRGQMEDSRRPREYDEVDALIVECAWRSSLLTILTREMLRGYYIFRLHPGHIGRRLSLSRSEFDSRFYFAHTSIEEVLAKMDSLAQNRREKIDRSASYVARTYLAEVPPQNAKTSTSNQPT